MYCCRFQLVWHTQYQQDVIGCITMNLCEEGVLFGCTKALLRSWPKQQYRLSVANAQQSACVRSHNEVRAVQVCTHRLARGRAKRARRVQRVHAWCTIDRAEKLAVQTNIASKKCTGRALVPPLNRSSSRLILFMQILQTRIQNMIRVVPANSTKNRTTNPVTEHNTSAVLQLLRKKCRKCQHCAQCMGTVCLMLTEVWQ